MAGRRSVLMAGLVGLAAGCAAAGPPDFSYGGGGFQPGDVRLNLEYARRNLGDMARYRGRPAEAAAALAQFEAIIAGLRDPANNLPLSQVMAEMILNAQRQARAAVGIPPGLDAATASAALAAAVGPLVSGDQGSIRAALSNPAFTLGPEATLARLTTLPPLPNLESIAPTLSTLADAEFTGGGFRRRR